MMVSRGFAVKRILAIALFLVLLFSVSTCAIYSISTSRYHFVVWDLHQLWSGSRALVLGGENPYSDSVTLRIQTEMYGRPARPDENATGFFYPLYTVYLILPVALMPYALAEAAWFSVLEIALLAGMVAAVGGLGWKLRPLAMAGLALGAAMLYPVTWSFILGQISLVVFAMMAMALWALRERRDVPVGVLLALATIKPQMTFLFVPALLVWAAVRGRWRVVIGFATAFAGLLISSLIWLPTWVGDFLSASNRYLAVMPFRPPVQLWADWCCAQYSTVAMVVLLLFLLGIVVWDWWQTLGRNGQVDQSVALTLVVTTLVAPRTSLVNQVMLLLPLVMVLRDLSARGVWGRVVGVGSALTIVVGMWGVRVWGIPPGPQDYEVEHIIMSPILPVVLLLAVLALIWRKQEA